MPCISGSSAIRKVNGPDAPVLPGPTPIDHGGALGDIVVLELLDFAGDGLLAQTRLDRKINVAF